MIIPGGLSLHFCNAGCHYSANLVFLLRAFYVYNYIRWLWIRQQLPPHTNPNPCPRNFCSRLEEGSQQIDVPGSAVWFLRQASRNTVLLQQSHAFSRSPQRETNTGAIGVHLKGILGACSLICAYDIPYWVHHLRNFICSGVIR